MHSLPSVGKRLGVHQPAVTSPVWGWGGGRPCRTGTPIASASAPGSRLVLGRAKGRVHCVSSPLDVTAKQRLLLTHSARPHWEVEAAGLSPTPEASPASRPSPGGCGERDSTAGDSRQNSAQARGPGYGHVPRLGAGPPGLRPMGPSEVLGAEPRRRREPTRE